MLTEEKGYEQKRVVNKYLVVGEETRTKAEKGGDGGDGVDEKCSEVKQKRKAETFPVCRNESGITEICVMNGRTLKVPQNCFCRFSVGNRPLCLC